MRGVETKAFLATEHTETTEMGVQAWAGVSAGRSASSGARQGRHPPTPPPAEAAAQRRPQGMGRRPSVSSVGSVVNKL